MGAKRIEQRLFARPGIEPRPLAALRAAGQIAWLIARDFFDGRLDLYATGLVYSTLVAIVPLLAFAIAVLQAIGVHGVLGPALHHLFEPLGPSGGAFADKLLGFVANVHIGVLGAIGILVLAFAALSLLRKIQNGLNEAWQVTETRSPLSRALEYLYLLVVGPVFLFAAFGLTALLTNRTIRHHLAGVGPLLPVAGKVLPYLIAVAAFTLINFLTPNTRVRTGAAFAAGIAGGLAWQAVGQLFAWLTARSTQLSAIYSSFAILILFLTWIYISWLILFLGARIGFYVQNPLWRRPRAERRPLAPAGAEATALDIMLVAAEHRASGGRALSLRECVLRLGVPGPRLVPVFEQLLAAKLLRYARGRGYVLTRDAAEVSVADVLRAARGEPSGFESGRLGELLERARAAHFEALGAITLADLAVRHPQDDASPGP